MIYFATLEGVYCVNSCKSHFYWIIIFLITVEEISFYFISKISE